VACLWEELKGTGRSLSFLLPTSPGLWAVFAMSTLDALVFVGAGSREVVCRLTEELQGSQEEEGRL
jgi:hypothetical protein